MDTSSDGSGGTPKAAGGGNPPEAQPPKRLLVGSAVLMAAVVIGLAFTPLLKHRFRTENPLDDDDKLMIDTHIYLWKMKMHVEDSIWNPVPAADSQNNLWPKEEVVLTRDATCHDWIGNPNPLNINPNDNDYDYDDDDGGGLKASDFNDPCNRKRLAACNMYQGFGTAGVVFAALAVLLTANFVVRGSNSLVPQTTCFGLIDCLYPGRTRLELALLVYAAATLSFFMMFIAIPDLVVGQIAIEDEENAHKKYGTMKWFTNPNHGCGASFKKFEDDKKNKDTKLIEIYGQYGIDGGYFFVLLGMFGFAFLTVAGVLHWRAQPKSTRDIYQDGEAADPKYK